MSAATTWIDFPTPPSPDKLREALIAFDSSFARMNDAEMQAYATSFLNCPTAAFVRALERLREAP